MLPAAGCTRVDEAALPGALKCGMSRQQAESAAKRLGYRQCFTPTLAAQSDVPDYACRTSDKLVSFWAPDGRLRAYAYSDSSASCPGQESGCTSETIELCISQPAPP